ncbi:tumor necrosis factor receptor superfamily member 5-like isoform X2 [Labrus mixtus]|uniref:tumor necrosis factor receptor superfamily member 5-like isoform X2 n=1 Tax=Labrus mixtus TaxID=508554 RepID=UPI0029C0A2AD|nr:tumor necrosis factor receptor superfamily member 5-like isoform X2 [Labrus mixtus]
MCPPGGRVYEDCTDSRSTLCERCPEGTFMNHPTSRTQCYDCKRCDEGGWVYADCTESRSTLCKPCTDGTFIDHPTSRTQCYICKSCDEGSGLKMKTSCTIVSDTVCEPLEGFYCSDSRKDDCVEARKHRRCEPGEYIREHGTSSTDTVCSTCSDGTFSDGTFTSCLNHKQCDSEGLKLLRAGTKTEDAQCGGKVSHRTGLIICVVVVVVVVVMFLVFVLGVFYFRWRRIIRHLISGKVSTVTMKHDHVYFIDIMVCLIIYLIFISNVLFQETEDKQDCLTRYVLNSLYCQSVLCSMI